MTTELFGVIDNIVLAAELTCVLSELNDDPTKLELATTTVLPFESVTAKTLLCELAGLLICADENLTEVILDPTDTVV